MLTVDEALRLVLATAQPLDSFAVAADRALDLTLAEDVTSDIDSPPHDKALVDGYAVRSADLTGGVGTLDVIEDVTAGSVPTRTVSAGQCTRVMTGAPLPEGADSMVMIERSRPMDGAAPRVELNDPALRLGQNIMRCAESMSRGQVSLSAGRILRPLELGVLAEVGRTQVKTIRRPVVAVLSTGNELVAPGATPGAGQIRNSNSPMLLACLRRVNAEPQDLGIARDSRDDLRQRIGEGLAADMLILSGGVSAGVLDLVPSVFAEMGVREVFHKVRLKPGKPIWFGVRESAENRTLVFGLPGNPSSSLVCFELFVRPALARLSGRTAPLRHWPLARLAKSFRQKGDRPAYVPAAVRWDALSESEPLPTIEPLDWHGSADLAGLARADALAHFPAAERTFQEGELIEYRLLD